VDRWEIIEDKGGWGVYRNNRVVKYDCYDLDDAMREVKRKAGSGVRVTVYDIDEERSTKTTR
jgi:hypothetical protein